MKSVCYVLPGNFHVAEMVFEHDWVRYYILYELVSLIPTFASASTGDYLLLITEVSWNFSFIPAIFIEQLITRLATKELTTILESL